MLESTGEQNWAVALDSQGELDRDPGRPTASVCLGQRVTQDTGFAVLTEMAGHVLMTSQLSALQLSAHKEGWQVCVVAWPGPPQPSSGSPSQSSREVNAGPRSS